MAGSAAAPATSKRSPCTACAQLACNNLNFGDSRRLRRFPAHAELCMCKAGLFVYMVMMEKGFFAEYSCQPLCNQVFAHIIPRGSTCTPIPLHTGHLCNTSACIVCAQTPPPPPHPGMSHCVSIWHEQPWHTLHPERAMEQRHSSMAIRYTVLPLPPAPLGVSQILMLKCVACLVTSCNPQRLLCMDHTTAILCSVHMPHLLSHPQCYMLRVDCR